MKPIKFYGGIDAWKNEDGTVGITGFTKAQELIKIELQKEEFEFIKNL